MYSVSIMTAFKTSNFLDGFPINTLDVNFSVS